jgi:hypothetical protein
VLFKQSPDEALGFQSWNLLPGFHLHPTSSLHEVKQQGHSDAHTELLATTNSSGKIQTGMLLPKPSGQMNTVTLFDFPTNLFALFSGAEKKE